MFKKALTMIEEQGCVHVCVCGLLQVSHAAFQKFCATLYEAVNHEPAAG